MIQYRNTMNSKYPFRSQKHNVGSVVVIINSALILNFKSK